MPIEIPLPSSKSESNRALIIRALSEQEIHLMNLSKARDTQVLIQALESDATVRDTHDAGTATRFLTAYACAKGLDIRIQGTERMHQRPIKILVDALRQLGASIEYAGKEGFPPLIIKGTQSKLTGDFVKLRGDVSSQYLSALLMIAPTLPRGLVMEIEGKIASQPYLMMTLHLMAKFRVSHSWDEKRIEIEPQNYQTGEYVIEGDWSAAGYWYSLVALSENLELKLLGLREHSWQGDRAMVDWMYKLGVATDFQPDGIWIRKSGVAVESLWMDFTHIPDQAQTFAVLAAALGVQLRMTGLESLRIKETDRIAALQLELQKFGCWMAEIEEGVFEIGGSFHPSEQAVATYEDHRMAMAFAPLRILQANLSFEHPEVVAKSYPDFWEHLSWVL